MRRAAALLALAALGGCLHGTTTQPPLADDFRHGLARWQVEAEAGDAAHVSADNGVMDIDTPEGLSVWWTQPISGPVAIEYEVMAVSEGGANDAVSDVNAFWMASDPASASGSPLDNPRSGAFATYDTLKTYYVGIGGNRNETTRLRRYVGREGDRPLLPEHDRSDAASLIVPNRWTQVRLVADGTHIAVDYAGEPLFTMDAAQPYRRGWFALRTTKSHLKIRNFRIVPLDGRKGD